MDSFPSSGENIGDLLVTSDRLGLAMKSEPVVSWDSIFSSTASLGASSATTDMQSRKPVQRYESAVEAPMTIAAGVFARQPRARMAFEVLGEIWGVETIAVGRQIRELPALVRLYGLARWRKRSVLRECGYPMVRSNSPNYTGMRRTASVRRS